MRELTLFEYAMLITGCLAMTLAGMYMLANFSRLFRRSIRHELLRKNVVVWLIVFSLSLAMTPLSGFYILIKFGWIWFMKMQLITTTLTTLIIYNAASAVAENKRLQKLSFIQHKILVAITLIITTLIVHVPVSYIVFGNQVAYLRYAVINSIYSGGFAAFIYAVMSYLEIERKRKFDEKELELSRMRELKAKAELEVLHSKVNPHFLYNALNSIADLSVTDGKKARKMTIALADLFRYSINYSNNNYSTVKDELEMAQVYLLIEKIRFEDQLNYTISVEDDVNHYLVPRFVLQPIVENAVKHGLKATGRMTEIHLEVKREGEGLVMNVKDNGPAFPAELNPGYGVKSVYDKLDLLFPNKFEIHFHNEPQKQVSIHIQKLMKNEQTV